MREFQQVIKLVRGSEQNIRVTEDLCNEHYYMHKSYQQAVRALAEIVRQTQRFHTSNKEYGRSVPSYFLNDALFCYSGNIIAFEGRRGTGKTQTLLSFTRILRNAGIKRKWNVGCGKLDWSEQISFLDEADKRALDDVRFHVLPPISPSVLEEKQNILYLVLSRLYDYANEQLQEVHNYEECDRKSLSKLFSACLSGINGIKRNNDDALDLADLQNISDGTALRMHFYELVQRLIQMNTIGLDSKDAFLVLQLDDADSQIYNSYMVMDDIRKYLVIPNLIIVMSVDISSLNRIITQEHGKPFGGTCTNNEDLRGELAQMARKYIDKLIPPSHMIHLPKLDQIIKSSPDRILLRYVKENDTPVFNWMTDKDGNEIDWDVQNMLFMLIYRKTGVVFVRPKSYLHNIVPRTLRGLSQLLYFLSRMDDIPLLTDDAWKNTPTLARELKKQLSVAEPNLEAFERYFVNDWIDAKFQSDRDRNFLKEFSRAAGSNRVSLAMHYLRERYPSQSVDSFSSSSSSSLSSGSSSGYLYGKKRVELEADISRREKDHRLQDDFLLFFAIRAILTLSSHKRVLQCKIRRVEQYLEQWEFHVQGKKNGEENDESLAPLLAFDYNPEYTHLPEAYLIPQEFIEKVFIIAGGSWDQSIPADQVEKREADHPIIDGDKKKIETPLNTTSAKKAEETVRQIYTSDKHNLLKSCMISKSHYGQPSVGFMNLLTFMLRIGCNDPDLIEAEYADVRDRQRQAQQYALYEMQEAALFIACNWDVQDHLYKYIESRFKKLTTRSDMAKRCIDVGKGQIYYSASLLYAAIDDALSDVNTKAFREYISRPFGGDEARKLRKDSIGGMFERAYFAIRRLDFIVKGMDTDWPFFLWLLGAELEDITRRDTAKPRTNIDILNREVNRYKERRNQYKKIKYKNPSAYSKSHLKYTRKGK